MTENKTKESSLKEEIEKNQWQIRPCHLYKEEYSDCTSFKARFHQYFIHGQSTDCTQWKRDYDNCCRYEEKEDLKSAKEIIQSETKRRQERLKAHYSNNIWNKRKSPPEDWNKPLPEWMVKEFENTYLNVKAKEMRGEATETLDVGGGYCSIM